MSGHVYLSYPPDSDRWVDEIASFAQDLGLGITGRHVPVGGALELIPDLRQQLRASTVTVVLFDEMLDPIVNDEVEWTREFGMGLVGIRREEATPLPSALYEAGAEVLTWISAEDRVRLHGAITAAARGAELLQRVAARGTGSGAQCARPRRPA